MDEMTHADKRMNLMHFGSDPADIRIRINPEIRIRIPDQILALAEFAFFECFSCHHNSAKKRLQLSFCNFWDKSAMLLG